MAIFNGYVKTVEVAVESSEKSRSPRLQLQFGQSVAMGYVVVDSPALVSLQLFIAVNVCLLQEIAVQ